MSDPNQIAASEAWSHIKNLPEALEFYDEEGPAIILEAIEKAKKIWDEDVEEEANKAYPAAHASLRDERDELSRLYTKALEFQAAHASERFPKSEIIRDWQKFAKQLGDKLGCGSMDTDILAAVDKLVEALEFYADPENYHAILILPDRPSGAFADDFSDAEHPDYDRWMPGKLARETLAAMQKDE